MNIEMCVIDYHCLNSCLLLQGTKYEDNINQQELSLSMTLS